MTPVGFCVLKLCLIRFLFQNYQLTYDKLVNQLREENKLLRLEAEDIRQKLRDAQGDNQVRFNIQNRLFLLFKITFFKTNIDKTLWINIFLNCKCMY